MTTDGSAVASSRTPPGTPLAYDSTSGTMLMVSGSDLLRFDPSQATPIACLLDAADLNPVAAIAPGELLAMFGRFLYNGGDPFNATISPVNGSFPAQVNGVAITANQTRAPLLYLSGQQINFQAPYEIAGSSQANLSLSYSDVNGRTVSDSRTLLVAARSPVAFLSQPSAVNQTFPLTLNADGTVNSQINPAAAGAGVTIFLDGLGVTNPIPVTGLVSTGLPTPPDVSLTVIPSCGGAFCFPAPVFASANPAPGSISGVTRVQLVAPSNPHPPSTFQSIFSLSLDAFAVRDTNLSFWVK
jgi:uncharacterized protein (TIGR03437 family)